MDYLLVGNRFVGFGCGVCSRSSLRGVATFLCLFSGCTPTHPFVNASVFQTTAARSRQLRHGLCLTIVSRHQGVSIMSTPGSKAGSRGPHRLSRVREGRRRRKTPSTDASRESNRISSLSWFLTLELCVEPPSSSCGKGSQTHWVGRKPGSRGSGLAAAGPRVVASLCPQRTIAANARAEGTLEGHFVLARVILRRHRFLGTARVLVFLFSSSREEEPVTLLNSTVRHTRLP